MNEEIIELLAMQFGKVMRGDEEYYSPYRVLISNEQQYIKTKDRDKNAIYIVVRFLPASLNFGQTVLPITINAIAERNKIDVCQRLLLEFAQTYNLTDDESGTIKQTYTSPSIMSNFNEMFDGFRSLFYMSGTFLISKNANPFKVYVSGESEEIDCITVSDTFDVQLDTQAFFNTDNFTKSVGTVGTFTLNITSYLMDTDFLNKVLAVKLKDLKKQPAGVNTTFRFDIVFKNGYEARDWDFKLVNATVQEEIGELPIISMTFTR